MIRSCSIFILATVVQFISCQGPPQFPGPREPYGPHSANDPRPGPLVHPYQERIPRHCWRPPPGVNPHQCCPIPRLYSDEVLDECGVEKPSEDGSPPKQPPDFECKKGTCLMKSYDLLNDDDSIDVEKTRAYIDSWAQEHPNFTEAILIAKDKCLVEGKLVSGIPTDCQPDKLFFCMVSEILWNCRLNEEIEGCSVLKEHMEECKPYYQKPLLKGQQ